MSKKKPRPVPPWDDYFMALAFIVASRSKDPSTQIGCVIVDAKHRIQGTGYNGVASAITDTEVDWSRPNKYGFVDHAEENAIDHVTGHPDTLDGSTLYVTGPPCSRCVRRIIRKKIRKVIYGPQPIQMIDEADWALTRELVKLSRLSLERYGGNLNWFRDRLDLMTQNLPEVFQLQSPLPL